MDGYPRAVLRTGGLLLLAALMAGCGAVPTPTPQPQPLTSGTQTFTPPPIEPTTTTTSTQAPVDDDPVISLARLPIGGFATLDEDDPTRQCVEVSWIVNTDANPVIPSGYAVEVTRAVFSGPGFSVVAGGCGTTRPKCLGLIMRAGKDTCDLAVRAGPKAKPNVEVKVGLTGILYCPRKVGKTGCQKFADAVAKEPGVTIPLELPPPPGTSSTGPQTGTGTAAGQGTSSGLTGSGG